MRLFLSCGTILVLAAGLRAENISGSILIKRRLTKRSVTPSVSIYQRGVSVELGTDAEQDPLAFERSRVVIWVEGPGPAGHDSAASMQQLERRFLPDVIVVPVGSAVSFPNMDPIFHNVFSLSHPKSFDLGNYSKGESRSITFSKSGIVYVNCHLHPNMAGVIVVTPNQWNAKADASGQFQLRDLPPGEYTVVAWHKTAGYFRKAVRVSPGADANIKFFIPIDAPESEKAVR